MDDPALLSIVIGIGVIVLIVGIGLAISGPGGSAAEDRLAELVGGRKVKKPKKEDLSSGILARPAAIDLGRPSFWTRMLPNAENLNMLYEQADVNFSFNRFMSVVAGLGAAGAVFGLIFRLPLVAVPAVAILWASLPFFWLMYRRRRRIDQFVESMPEAVELVSRALRAGHGLASGLHLVAEEMKGPIADEFNRIFEEQNLGIPIELALRNMADRIPVMDVRFFVIAVVIQRSTGGDLAEVLDKIGRLIRQRFELFGHVKALTAEGRLSGIVLLGMPPAL
ncbi:MAG TPA: type II secretion system F family protein, partial [Planctomycetaceae bacterium]|nr:type II secretion system F family protein [Planctomycetaceae bacterium]